MKNGFPGILREPHRSGFGSERPDKTIHDKTLNRVFFRGVFGYFTNFSKKTSYQFVELAEVNKIAGFRLDAFIRFVTGDGRFIRIESFDQGFTRWRNHRVVAQIRDINRFLAGQINADVTKFFKHCHWHSTNFFLADIAGRRKAVRCSR